MRRCSRGEEKKVDAAAKQSKIILAAHKSTGMQPHRAVKVLGAAKVRL
jgi:hypothetical protein